MVKYLIKNVDEFRQVRLGRLRFNPGTQMWVDEELHDHRKTQSLVSSGILSVLAVRGKEEASVPIAEEVVVPPAQEVVEEPLSEDRVTVEPLSVEASLTRKELTSMKVVQLKEIATEKGISFKGLRKAALIDALLEE